MESARENEHIQSQPIREDGDIQGIGGVKDLIRQFCAESKNLWYLAGPTVFTALCQYMMGIVTQIFLGHVGTLELAAFAMANSVIGTFTLGVMFGMGTAVQTLCGQAFGAGERYMLGIYMQRSWIILNATSLMLVIVYVFATPILKLIHQSSEIAEPAGVVALCLIPQIFAYAMNYPITNFLQSQSKVRVISAISVVTLILHTFFSWLFMIKLKCGMVGGTLVLNASWWFMVVAQLCYIFSGTCGAAWPGFSWKAFEDLGGFVRLSFASAVMSCLEGWYFMLLVMFAGYLKNAKVAIAAFSVCFNILGLIMTEALGLNAAISVRVSNELGAGHPRKAKLAVTTVGVFAFLIGLFLAILLMITKKQFPSIFSNSEEVKQVVYTLTPLLATTLVTNNVQPALSGVAIGAGWQALVSYVNIGCYYFFGIPLGLIMCYKLNMGIKGLWTGMLSGTVLQTFILIWIIYKTNWNKEASIAEARVKKFGGRTNPTNEDVEAMNYDESGQEKKSHELSLMNS